MSFIFYIFNVIIIKAKNILNSMRLYALRFGRDTPINRNEKEGIYEWFDIFWFYKCWALYILVAHWTRPSQHLNDSPNESWSKKKQLFIKTHMTTWQYSFMSKNWRTSSINWQNFFPWIIRNRKKELLSLY